MDTAAMTTVMTMKGLISFRLLPLPLLTELLEQSLDAPQDPVRLAG